MKGNIDVRDGGTGGYCYSQSDKFFFYWNNVYAGQARLGFGNWLVEKVNLQRATGVVIAVGEKKLPFNARPFPI